MDNTADFAVNSLIQYSFDLGGYTVNEIIERWLNDYPAVWVRLAVIEALYQGRYKAISVEQILSFWHRRGKAFYHFNHEFERLVCGNFLFGAVVGEKPVQVDNTTEVGDNIYSTTVGEEPAQPLSDNDLHLPKADKSSIEQFTPQANSSDFYSKLKAISQSDHLN